MRVAPLLTVVLGACSSSEPVDWKIGELSLFEVPQLHYVEVHGLVTLAEGGSPGGTNAVVKFYLDEYETLVTTVETTIGGGITESGETQAFEIGDLEAFIQPALGGHEGLCATFAAEDSDVSRPEEVGCLRVGQGSSTGTGTSTAGTGTGTGTPDPDTPPLSTITSPLPHEIFEFGQLIVATGVVSDTEQTPETLDIAWSITPSNGGAAILLSEQAASPAGSVTASSSTTPIGSWLLELLATDEAGNTATDSVRFNVVDPFEMDNDGDGYTPNSGDCDDSDPSVNPGAPDPPGDGVDQNCNGLDG